MNEELKPSQRLTKEQCENIVDMLHEQLKAGKTIRAGNPDRLFEPLDGGMVFGGIIMRDGPFPSHDKMATAYSVVEMLEALGYAQSPVGEEILEDITKLLP